MAEIQRENFYIDVLWVHKSVKVGYDSLLHRLSVHKFGPVLSWKSFIKSNICPVDFFVFTDGRLEVSCMWCWFSCVITNIKFVKVLKTLSSQVTGRVWGLRLANHGTQIEDSAEDFSDQIQIPNDRWYMGTVWCISVSAIYILYITYFSNVTEVWWGKREAPAPQSQDCFDIIWYYAQSFFEMYFYIYLIWN